MKDFVFSTNIFAVNEYLMRYISYFKNEMYPTHKVNSHLILFFATFLLLYSEQKDT